jgi:integrase
MPYAVKHAGGKSPYWYAVYRDETGRRRKRSTKLTSKAKALEMAYALQKAAKLARDKTLTEARTRELLSEILQSVNGEGLRVFTVAQWFDHFVKQKQKSRASQTAKKHEQMMKEFIAFLDHKANLNIAAVSSKDVADFRDHREARGLAPSSLNVDLRCLSSAFNAALRQGHISVNPCLAIEPLKDKQVHKAVFTPEQVTALVKTAEGEWKGVILTAFYTGARFGDCANLQWKHLDLVSDIKTIRFTQGKTKREIVIAVHPALEDFLLKLPTAGSDDDFVFPSLAQRKVNILSVQFRRIMEKSHIEQRVIRERGESSESGRSVYALSFHSLRHSFSSLLANAGIAEETRMALTGHTTREMQQRYTHRQLSVLRDAVSVLPRV